jgi:hypothetical protein
MWLSLFAGVWTGASLCATSAPACRNEQVVYYIDEIAGKSDRLNVRADKIVDGKAITMGSGPWEYDSAGQRLSWDGGHGVWVLRISDGKIEGTLTEPDGTVFRRMTLTKR